MQYKLTGRAIAPGTVEGEALVSKMPMSFYGGVDPKTGNVMEQGHELEGKNIKDKILVFPCGKGSTVGSYVLYGLRKYGMAPKAIVNQETETIVATGVILAAIPCVDQVEVANIKTGDRLRVDGDAGTVESLG